MDKLVEIGEFIKQQSKIGTQKTEYLTNIQMGLMRCLYFLVSQFQ